MICPMIFCDYSMMAFLVVVVDVDVDVDVDVRGLMFSGVI